MLKNKLIILGITWVAIVFCYILLAVTMPAFNDITAQASADIQASANTSNMPGIVGGVDSAPVYIWFIPGLAGILITVWVLKRN